MRVILGHFLFFSFSILLLFDHRFAYTDVKKSDAYCVKNSGVDIVDTPTTITEKFADKMKEVGVKTIARYYDYEK